MSNPKVVFVVPVEVTEQSLEVILNVLNRYEIEEGEPKLTVEEVVDNLPLLDYLCTEAAQDGTALFDPVDYWNNDGWCDFKDYRTIE